MTNEEAIKEIQDASDYEVRHGDVEHHYEDIMRRVEAFEKAVNALQKEPCEDAVSRQAVLDLIDSDWKYEGLEMGVANLPSVTPQQKTGRWISHSEHCEMNNLRPSGLGCYFWCSKCDCGIDYKYFHMVNYNYCPHCGADMRGAE